MYRVSILLWQKESATGRLDVVSWKRRSVGIFLFTFTYTTVANCPQPEEGTLGVHTGWWLGWCNSLNFYLHASFSLWTQWNVLTLLPVLREQRLWFQGKGKQLSMWEVTAEVWDLSTRTPSAHHSTRTPSAHHRPKPSPSQRLVHSMRSSTWLLCTGKS